MYEEIYEIIRKLSEKRGDIERQAWDVEHRAFNAREAGLIAEIDAEINEQRKQLPVSSPLTLQDFGFDGRTKGQGISPARGRDYRSMFGIAKGKELSCGQFKDFNEYLTVLSTGKFDRRLIQDVASESVPSSGGFSVPEQFAAWLLDSSLESEIVRPRATVWPMTTSHIKVPGFDAATHTSTLYGGLSGTWLGELGAATEVFAKLRQIELIVKKLACYTSASNELVADGIDYETQIQSALVKTIGWFLDYSFIQGTGATMPLGIINDPALVTVLKETGQKAATIVWENTIKMYAKTRSSMHGKCLLDRVSDSFAISPNYGPERRHRRGPSNAW